MDKETMNEVVETFDSFEEVEEIVTATEKGTFICCF